MEVEVACNGKYRRVMAKPKIEGWSHAQCTPRALGDEGVSNRVLLSFAATSSSSRGVLRI